MKDPSRVRVTGPLAPYAAGFAAELVAVGYRPASAAIHLRLLAHLSRWVQTEGLVPRELDEAELERFRRRHVARCASLRGAQGLVPLLGYLRSLGVVPAAQRPVLTAAGELLERYRRYLMIERGLTAETASGYVDVVTRFVESRIDAVGRLELWELEAADVLGFVLAESARRSRKSSKSLVTGLRSLLAFVHVEGLTARCAGGVGAVGGGSAAGGPRARLGP
jgi:hypothetical protein